MVACLTGALLAGSIAPVKAQELPRKWGEVTWTLVSSDTGDLEVPFDGAADQTDAQILDVDNDGANDFVLTSRNFSPAGVWYRRDTAGWTRHVFETTALPLEAGGTNHDVDGDGDLDIVVGEGAQGPNIYWWENPFPVYDPATPWTRHVIKNGGLNKHHDVIFGDVDGDGIDEFIFWNSERSLQIAEVPPDPAGGAWPFTTIFVDPDKNEGLAIVDVNLDGVDDIVGAGRWFEYVDPATWTVHEIDPAMEFSRVAAGQLVPGGRPEIVFVVGDVSLPIDGTSFLTMYEWDGVAWVGTSLLAELTHAGHSLDIVDFNNDGLLDIFNAEMTLGGNPNAAGRVFYGDGTGQFTVQEFSTGIEHHQSKVGDLDRDGDLDILGKPFTDGSPAVHVWLNSDINPGIFPIDQWERHSVDAAQPWLASHALWGDFDLDGAMDIVSGGWVYESQAGDYAQPWSRTLIGAPLNNVALVHDLDGDGDLDLLGTDGLTQSPDHPGSTSLYWGRNEGDGTFTVLGNITAGVTGDQSSAFIQGIAPMDLGNDGSLDIAISWNFGEFGLSGIDLLTVPADPAFDTWPLTTISPVSEGEEIGLDDIDGDGHDDIFQGSGWLQNSHPVWTRFDSTALIANNTPYDDPDRVSMVDIDGDGDKDAVIGLLFEAISIPTDLVWLEHPADPTQEWPLHVIGSGIGGGFSLSVGDVDNDGDADIALGEHVGQTRLLIFENIDYGASWVEHVVDDGVGVDIDHHDGALLVDFENDGDLDIVSLGWTNQKVWFYENKALEPGDISDLAPPSAPAGLVATPFSSTQINLSWQPSFDNRGVFQYVVLRDGVAMGSAGGLQYADTDLTPSTTYNYEIVAVDLSGNESPPGDPASTTTPTPDLVSPTPPTDLEATVSAHWVDLAWTPATDDRGVIDYLLRRNGVDLAVLGASSTSYFDSGLTADTWFDYELIAFDADGNGSDPLVAQITAITLPPPTGLWAAYGFEDTDATVLDSSIYGNDATLQSNAVLEPDGYYGNALETNGLAGHVDLGNLDIPTEHLTLMAWINADDFGREDARIISKSTGKRSSDHVWMLSTISGPHARFRLRTDDGTPTTTVVGTGGTLLAGTWHHIAATYDGTTMRLYQDGIEVGSAPRTGPVFQAPTVGAQIGANPGVSKQVFDGRIDELKIFGRSLTPAEIALEMVTPVPAPPTDNQPPDTESPTTPGLLAAVATSATTIDLSWTAATDDRLVTSYVVARDGVDVAIVPSLQLSFSDMGLDPGLTYSYTVVAVDAALNMSMPAGPVSETTFPPDVDPPSVPGSLLGNATSFSTVVLSWVESSDNAAVGFYLVTRDGIDIASVSTPATGYIDVTATPDTMHVYYVTAVDTSGNVATAGPVAVLTPPAPDVPDDLWAAYSFAGAGSTVTDASGNGNNGVLTGSASIVASGQFDDAVELTGGAGAVDLGGIDIAGDQLTIAAWVNADDFGISDARIVSKSTGSAADDHLWMLSTISGQRLRFRLKTDDGNSTTTLIGTGGSLTAGTWHFVAATYDGATMRLFIDGTEVGDAPKTGTTQVDPGVNAWIGNNPGSGNRAFDGRIDEFRIYTRALGAPELLSLATTSVESPTPDTSPPTTPGLLTAVATGPTTIDLSWTASTDDRFVASYLVSRDGIDVATLPSSQLSFSDIGLDAGVTYNYTVVAVDASLNMSAPAGPVTETTFAPDVDPPSVPGSLAGNATSFSTVVLSWVESSDNVAVGSYLVTRDGVDVASVLAPATGYIDVTATPDTTHVYYVTAVDTSGNVATAGPVAVLTPPAPDVPDDLWAAYSFAGAGTLVTDASGNGNDGTLTGTASIVPSGQFDDAVELIGGSGAVDLGGIDIVGDQLTIAAWVNANDFGVSDARIVSKSTGSAANDHLWMLSTISGQRLRFRLKTDDGNSTTTLIGTGGALTAGTWHFVAATYDGATMRLFIDGTEVGAAPKTGATQVDPSVDAWIGNNPGTGSQAFDGRIDELRIYTRALGAPELLSLATTSVESPTPDTTPPTTPGLLTAFATGPTSIGLSWAASTDDRFVASYVVARDGVDVATLPSSQLTFSDNGLAPGFTYDYTVVAVDSALNTSAPAGPVTETTFGPDVDPPSAPGSLAGNATSFSTVALSWVESSDNVAVDFYLVTRDGVDIASVSAPATGYIDVTATPDTTHAYHVTAVDTSGNVATAGPVAVLTPPAPDVPDDLWAAYGFAGAGSTVTDESGNGNQGDLTGTASIVSNGQFDEAVELTGGSGAVDLGGIDIVGDQLTIAAWVNADDFGIRDARIVSKSTGSAADEHLWMLSTISGQRLRFRLKTDDGNSTTTLIGIGGSLTAGTWHFVAATYDGATMRLFIDGSEVGSAAKTGAIAVDPSIDAWIGNNPGTGNQAFDGRIDEFRIFTRALSAAELLSLALVPTI